MHSFGQEGATTNQPDHDYHTMFERNIGFLTQTEQQTIAELSIGIAGCGGDGGLLAERLVRFGIGKILLADPDVFELHNINRQFGANSETISKNKARVVAEEMGRINPHLPIHVYEAGINQENIEEFVTHADILIDEIDFTEPHLSVLFAQEARRQNKYVFMGANIGWGASIFCFHPQGMTFEEHFRYDPNTNVIDPMRYIGTLPDHFEQTLFNEVVQGKRPVPGLSSSVGLVASLMSSQIIMFAIQKKEPLMAPDFLFFDAFDLSLKRR